LRWSRVVISVHPRAQEPRQEAEGRTIIGQPRAYG
jgi:hypothetical protein